jgi:hypothetical protein
MSVRFSLNTIFIDGDTLSMSSPFRLPFLNPLASIQ